MAGVPRRKPARTALPDEAAWLAERERLEQLDQADADAGSDVEDDADSDGDERPAGAPTPKRAPAGSSSLPRPTLKLPTRPSAGDIGGFLFGLGIYALFINYIHYGPLGVKGWLRAKFMNAPLDLPAPITNGSSSIDTGPAAPLSQGA